ncbi:Cyclin-D-binding Myb-like transcription factor 1 [Apostichopus japonicus]|uniref:Cyclin-D-binding Myb-like transcription factor 1 n=1 Tax=Stichopus japonicus TaxID=307972 RepID=A0A2G8JYX3_STIJA|nr:Cyclin-D-binding Myb-like transcription factor 1 [Apostichopus japonicus]
MISSTLYIILISLQCASTSVGFKAKLLSGMDIKDEDSSAGIGLEFNTEDHNQFVAFDPVGNHDHLVIRSAGQIDMTTGSLVVPEATVTVEADDVGCSDEDKVGRTEGLEPMETLATVATGKTIVEVDPADEEDLYDDFRDTKKSPVSVNQSWFTGKHAKESLQEQGHSWRQGMWSKEEVAILMKNIEDYVKTNKLKDAMEVIFQLKKEDRKDFYRTIAAGLNRPLFAVYRRVQRMYDAKNYVGKYSALDIEKLKSLRAELGNDWAQIGAKMGRSASSVKDKCRLLKEACHQGKWRFDEEERLTDAVYEVTKTTPGESITGGIPWQQDQGVQCERRTVITLGGDGGGLEKRQVSSVAAIKMVDIEENCTKLRHVRNTRYDTVLYSASVIWDAMKRRNHRHWGGVVVKWTGDLRITGSSLGQIIALCPWARHFISPRCINGDLRGNL